MLRVFESVSHELLDKFNCIVVTKKNDDNAEYEKLCLPVYEIQDKRELLKNKRVLQFKLQRMLGFFEYKR